MLSHLTYILKREETGRRHIEILLMELFGFANQATAWAVLPTMDMNSISFNPYATETSILIIIYYNKLNWFRLVIRTHLFSMTSFELRRLSFSSYFLCVYVFLRLWSFFNLKDRTKWCLVVKKKLQLFFWLILKK